MYIDTHCHVSKEYYENIDEVINNAEKENVKKIIISGCDKEGIKEALETVKKYENVYTTIGFHPDSADIITDEDLKELEKDILENKKVIGLGEIGLDYHYGKDNRLKQINLFKKQLEIAKKLDIPVVIHSRDAFQDTYDILKESNTSGVIHCFSGNITNAKMYIDLGYKIGIGGVLTFKNSKLKDVVKELNLKDIVTETDSPYLSPEPKRGTTNEPKNVSLVMNYLFEIRNESKEEIENTIENNTYEVFKGME